jgi:integrase
MFDEMLKAAGVPNVRFHDLRQTAATLLLVQWDDVRHRLMKRRRRA